MMPKTLILTASALCVAFTGLAAARDFEKG